MKKATLKISKKLKAWKAKLSTRNIRGMHTFFIFRFHPHVAVKDGKHLIFIKD
jgi:hypothetical protein